MPWPVIKRKDGTVQFSRWVNRDDHYVGSISDHDIFSYFKLTWDLSWGPLGVGLVTDRNVLKWESLLPS